MRFLSKLFSESSEVSCMRLMAMISLLVGSVIAFIAVYRDGELGQAVPMVSVFIGAAFSGKVFQKYVEVNNSNKKTSLED